MKQNKNLNSVTNKLIFLFAGMLFPIILSAQIKIAEDKPKEEPKPEWWKCKDIIFTPYDSSYIHVEFYPTVDAYKKYIGQQLYLPSYDDEFTQQYINGSLYGKDESYSYYVNKYFTVIDVLSYKEADSKVGIGKTGGRWAEKIGDCYFSIYMDTAPYFVLKETQSGNTIYAVLPRKFVLVGGFVKIQQNFIGLYIYELTEYGVEWGNYNKDIIKEKWICSDVTLKTKKGVEVILTLQNVNDKSIEKEIKYDDVYNERKYNHCKYWSKESFDNKVAQIAADVKQRYYEQYGKDIAARKQQEAKEAQQEAKRKQDLTNKYGAATAAKIIAGKYEIGMSKAVCKEIAGYEPLVSDKTATTETWKLGSIFSATYLYFEGDKLVRIVNY